MNISHLKQLYKNFKVVLNKESSADNGELYIFVVGINDYKKEKNLQHCKSDADNFLNFFYESKSLKKKNVYSFFYLGGQIENITRQFSSSANIEMNYLSNGDTGICESLKPLLTKYKQELINQL